MLDALRSLLPLLTKMPDWLKAFLLMAALFFLLNQNANQTTDLRTLVKEQGARLVTAESRVQNAEGRMGSLESAVTRLTRELDLAREDMRRMEGKLDVLLQRR